MNIEDVTIVVVPRDRYSVARESLDSLLAHTPPGFKLVYLTAGAPRALSEHLRREQARLGFQLLEIEHYVTPNAARNLGLSRVQTRYAVLMDNDVVFTSGWLEALLRCAEETEADVVTPLLCEGWPPHSIVHAAGGDYVPPEALAAFHADIERERELRERQHGLKQPLSVVRPTVQRGPTGFAELHCLLLRTTLLRRLGARPFDEALLATKEHLDFAMSVRSAGGSIVFEPESLVTFMQPNPARPVLMSDWPFYFLRWSDDWQKRSLDHFRAKWRLGRTDYRRRYASCGYRRQDALQRYFRRIPVLGHSSLLFRVLRRLEIWLNRAYANWYRARYPRFQHLLPQNITPPTLGPVPQSAVPPRRAAATATAAATGS